MTYQAWLDPEKTATHIGPDRAHLDEASYMGCVGTSIPKAYHRQKVSNTMSGPLRPPEWFYVATLNKWAYYDAGRNVVVAEDGTHLPTTFLAAAAARNRTSAQSRQTTLSYNTAEAASSTSNAAMARSAVYQAYTGTSPHVPAVSVDDLGAAVGTLRVSSPTLPTNTPSRPHVLRGYDSSSNVESIYQTSPDKDITDPYLYERGVTAHAKILAGTGVRETLSPGIQPGSHHCWHSVADLTPRIPPAL